MDQKKENKSTSKSFLESCRNAINKVEETLNKVSNGTEFKDLPLEVQIEVSQKIIKLIGDSGKAIDTLVQVEKKVESEEEQSTRRRAGTKTAQLED